MNYTINEKTAIKKKIKPCREAPLEIKVEKGNNLRIFCSKTAFENIRKTIVETVASNYVLEKTESRDILGKVVIKPSKLKRGMQEELLQYLSSTYTGPRLMKDSIP